MLAIGSNQVQGLDTCWLLQWFTEITEILKYSLPNFAFLAKTFLSINRYTFSYSFHRFRMTFLRAKSFPSLERNNIIILSVGNEQKRIFEISVANFSCSSIIHLCADPRWCRQYIHRINKWFSSEFSPSRILRHIMSIVTYYLRCSQQVGIIYVYGRRWF